MIRQRLWGNDVANYDEGKYGGLEVRRNGRQVQDSGACGGSSSSAGTQVAAEG